MESFTKNIPDDWTTTTPNKISKTDNPHTGNSAVNLADGAILNQTIPIAASNYYEFSFHARGNGAQTGLTANVFFVNGQGQSTPAATIQINQSDIPNAEFEYYRRVTSLAPANTVSARITFTAVANGSQTLTIDDVSLVQR